MRPIIIVCGPPHSYTSMVSKFLIDNGGYANEIRQNPEYDINYPTYEEKELQKFVKNRKRFSKYNLKHYFKSLPNDEVIIAKEPLSIYFMNDLAKYTSRKIKFVCVMRNPGQTILSSMDKSGKSFIYYFQRLSWLYDFMVDCEFELLPFVSERIKKDGPRLLKFCELNPDKINYGSIRKFSKRKPKYIKYRFSNFIWKKLSKLFNVFK